MHLFHWEGLVWVGPTLHLDSVCHVTSYLQTEKKYYRHTSQYFRILFMQEYQVLGEDKASLSFS